jgi:hypothetical protein
MSRQQTQTAVASMMKQNTGRNLLDSGGIYGRKFEQLATVDLTAIPYATLTEYGYEKSLFWHIVEHCGGVATKENDSYLAFDALHPDEDWFTTFEMWCKVNNITVHDVENTYNMETTIDGGFQAYNLEDADGEWFTAIMTHNGCDVRGGYSQPVMFGGMWEEIMSGLSDGHIFCNGCDTRLYTDDGYNWYNDDEGYNGKKTLDELWDKEQSAHICKCGGKFQA